MKKFSFLVLAVVAATVGTVLCANAQNSSPYWSQAGNSNATTGSKLGTTNAVPLRLFTNNKVRLYIDASAGNINIGNGTSGSSGYRLYVKGAAYGIYGTGTSYGIVGTGGNYGVYGSGTSAGLYGSGGTYGAYASGSTYGTYSYGGSYGVYGVGGSYGVYGDGSTSGYGVFGRAQKSYAGYFISDSSDALDAVSYGGYWGVYASSPTYGVEGIGNSYGVYGYSGSYIGTYGYSAGSYGLYGYGNYGVYGETRDNNSYYAGYFVGDVLSTTGVYATSDQKLKQNIRDLSSAMTIINQLHPKMYDFRHDGNYKQMNLPNGEHYGLIAQDLEKVLPNLVKNSKFEAKTNPDQALTKDNVKAIQAAKTEEIDFKAVNYQELIPILVKAMQEQDAKIQALTQQVQALTNAKQSIAANSTANARLSNGYISQLTPNPATNTTSIRYNNLPGNAQLFISDANGKMIKQWQLSNSSGVVSVDVSSLSAGTYTCALLANGKLLESKTLDVAR